MAPSPVPRIVPTRFPRSDATIRPSSPLPTLLLLLRVFFFSNEHRHRLRHSASDHMLERRTRRLPWRRLSRGLDPWRRSGAGGDPHASRGGPALARRDGHGDLDPRLTCERGRGRRHRRRSRPPPDRSRETPARRLGGTRVRGGRRSSHGHVREPLVPAERLQRRGLPAPPAAGRDPADDRCRRAAGHHREGRRGQPRATSLGRY